MLAERECSPYLAPPFSLAPSFDVEVALVVKLKEGKANHAKLLAAKQAKEAALHLQQKSQRSVSEDQRQLEVPPEQQFQINAHKINAHKNAVATVCC